PDRHGQRPGALRRRQQAAVAGSRPGNVGRIRPAHRDLSKESSTMTKHMTVIRQQWLAARLELLEAEKELTRRSDEVARRRQELPWVRIDKAYRFDTDAGSAQLADLFGGRPQLPGYHFMFGPGYTARRPSGSRIPGRV